MKLVNKIIIQLTCNKVGIDEFGNGYFEKKVKDSFGIKKRFVIYRGDIEASKIPSGWHLWLHYTCDKAPINTNTHKSSWQKIHLPNLTGTVYKHSPSAKDKKLGANYESWAPSK